MKRPRGEQQPEGPTRPDRVRRRRVFAATETVHSLRRRIASLVARSFGLTIAAAIIALASTPMARRVAGLPTRLYVPVGQRRDMFLGLPGDVLIHADAAAVHVDGRPAWPAWATLPAGRLAIQPLSVGSFHLDVRILGVIPLRRVTVESLPAVSLIPGGQAIGIIMNGDGLLVVGETSVMDPRGRMVAPAEAAGLEVGDVILRVDGRPVSDRAAIARLVERDGRLDAPVQLAIQRDGVGMTLSVRPVRAARLDRYVLGAWVNEGTSGIGTLTFFRPQSGVFGALGHAVTGSDDSATYRLKRGQIVSALVSGVNRGERGKPGRKLGIFIARDVPLGNIVQNTTVGVFGRLTRLPGGGLYSRPIPVATEDEVHVGPAKMLTVLSGSRVQAFDVEIEGIVPQQRPSGQGLIIRVTDKALLAETGGIVQGMSGSPIVQDGRLVGAVTHVFVNDPTRGYGVLATWMAETAGLFRPITAPLPSAS